MFEIGSNEAHIHNSGYIAVKNLKSVTFPKPKTKITFNYMYRNTSTNRYIGTGVIDTTGEVISMTYIPVYSESGVLRRWK